MAEWDDQEEREHFQSVVTTFKCYRNVSLHRVQKTEEYFKTLPAHHQKLMAAYPKNLKDIKHAIEANNLIIQLIIKDVEYMFENIRPGQNQTTQQETSARSTSVGSDLERVVATLKQLVRDWSDVGAKERDCCYLPIINEIVEFFGKLRRNPRDVKVLVPGAGLGRLAFEVARKGFRCQGNEFSLFMLFASQFVLNKCNTVNAYSIYPWVHQYVNLLSAEDQVKAITFPDVNPRELDVEEDFTMVAGDFLEVYTEPETWDCVATCFFIDCANNIASFIEAIHRILKPGGLWVNLGPLLYHFSDMANENSIEPSYEVVRQLITGMGFIIEKEQTNVLTTYAQNPTSMLQYQYRSVFFSCRKPIPKAEAAEASKESVKEEVKEEEN